MGFFDFLKKKKVETEKVIEIWNIGELNLKIGQLENAELQKFYSDIENAKDQIEVKLTNLRNSVVKLSNAKLPKDIDKSLIIRIESNRQNLVNRTKNACDFYFEKKLKPVSDIESLNKLLEVASETFNNINEASRYGGIVALGFEAEMTEVKNAARDANNVFKNLINLVNENKKKIESIEELKSTAEKITTELNRLNEIEKEISNIQNELNESAQKEIDLLKKKDQIENSGVYSTALKLKSQIGLIEKEIESLKIGFRNEFLIFKKPIQKFLHTFGQSLDKETYAKIANYLDEPLNGLIFDKELKIESTLSKILELVKDNTLDFEPDQRAKICVEIKKFLEQNRLLSVLRRYNQLHNEINSFKNKIGIDIVNDYDNLLKEINNIKIKEAENSKKLENLEKTKSTINSNIEALKKDIIDVLKADFNKEITIK